MSETKKGGQYTGKELAVLLRASIKMGMLMRQHREFLLNVLANYMGEEEHAQLVRLMERQYYEMSQKCADATQLLEREHARQQRAEEEEQAHGQ